VRRGSGPVPPAACTNQLAPRRLRVPDLTPTPCRRGQEHSSSTPRPPAGGTNPEPQKNKRHTTTRRTNHRGRCTTPRTPPHQLPGKVHAQPPHMTMESAQGAALSRGIRTYRAASSGRGSLQASRGEPGTPTARSPVPPTPPSRPTPPEGALRAPHTTPIPRRPRHNRKPAPPRRHPGRRPAPAREETTQAQRKGSAPRHQNAPRGRRARPPRRGPAANMNASPRQRTSATRQGRTSARGQPAPWCHAPAHGDRLRLPPRSYYPHRQSSLTSANRLSLLLTLDESKGFLVVQGARPQIIKDRRIPHHLLVLAQIAGAPRVLYMNDRRSRA
jgi:hypothetical protein